MKKSNTCVKTGLTVNDQNQLHHRIILENIDITKPKEIVLVTK
jgi:hypothetical protein